MEVRRDILVGWEVGVNLSWPRIIGRCSALSQVVRPSNGAVCSQRPRA